MTKTKSREDFYNETLIKSGYDESLVTEKFQKLSPKNLDVDLFQVKASIVFLSGEIEEIDALILEANQDHWKVMNWAQGKDDRT